MFHVQRQLYRVSSNPAIHATGMHMSLRLKTLKRNIASTIELPEKRKDIETAIDGLVNILPHFTDQAFETFIVDQVSKLSAEFSKNGDASMKRVLKLHDFGKLLERSNIRTIGEMSTTKPLKQIFSDFEARPDAILSFDDFIGTTGRNGEKNNVQVLDVPDPHVYLKEIAVLDESCLAGKGVSIKEISSKLIAVINVSLPLLEAANIADKMEANQARMSKPQSNAAGIEGILNLVTGDQAKLHTRRVFRVTRLVRDVSARIRDVENDRDSLKAKHDKPWMFMIQKDQQTPEEKYKEQMAWFDSEIGTAGKKLKHVLAAFKNAPECTELVDALQKMEKHVDINIIGALNNAIARIRAAGIKNVVLSKQDLDLARTAGIKIESVLATSESPIKDLDKINHDYFKAQERVHDVITTIAASLSKRSNEERAIVENGIIGALEQIVKNYEANRKRKSGSGFLCMASMMQDLEISLLESLQHEIGRLGLYLSERNIDPATIKVMLNTTGVVDAGDIDIEALGNHLDEKRYSGASFDAAMKLIHYTPLTREAYFSQKIVATREHLARIAATLKVFESIMQVLVELGGKIEELDPFLPRKFMAIEDISIPTTFSATIDAWFGENMGRLFVSGGAEKQKELTSKMTTVKAKIAGLEGMMVTIPKEILIKIKTTPILAFQQVDS
jgi:hypothetical protein